MHIKKLFFPRIPEDIIKEVYQSIVQPNGPTWNSEEFNMYHWLPANNAIQDWCRSNISPDLFWGVQVIDRNLPMHKDHGTQVKFNYIIDKGGIDPLTNYYDDEGKLLASYSMDSNTWYILNVAVNHSVTNIVEGKKRISITSRIMP